MVLYKYGSIVGYRRQMTLFVTKLVEYYTARPEMLTQTLNLKLNHYLKIYNVIG